MKENENKVMETAVDLEKIGDKVVGGVAHTAPAAKELVVELAAALVKSALGKFKEDEIAADNLRVEIGR